ncbi:MAG: hypothetical protein GY708_04110 [Actinomycetia bacterium]|nr:hypothetical protein [Actinomycetes bacterium]MCP4962350.1 hypothetical protein [Actinomycetes bacterium]
MVDMVKKIHKKSQDLLLPGEQILAASAVQAVGQFKKQVAFGAVGGLVGAAVGTAMANRERGDGAEADTMADNFPELKQGILAVSDQRWIMFTAGMSGAPKSVTAQWRHDQISSLSLDKGKLTSKVNITFTDGSVAQVEAVKAAKPAALVEAAASM